MANSEVAQADKPTTQPAKADHDTDWATKYRTAAPDSSDAGPRKGVQSGKASDLRIEFPDADKSADRRDDACKLLGNCEVGDFSHKPGPTENKIDNQAQRSDNVALVHAANKLADNSKLLPLVVDSSGHITRDSIGALLQANAATSTEGRPLRIPLLTAQEQADLAKAFSDLRPMGKAGIRVESLQGLSTAETETSLAGKSIQQKADALEAMGANLRSADKNIQVVDAVERNRSTGAKLSGLEQVGQPSPTQLDHSRFSQVAKRVLDRIDTEHKGGVTKEQLAKAIQDPSFKGEDAQALAALYKNFDQLQNFSGHEWMFSNRKILTAADLDKYQQFQNKYDENWADAQDMKAWVDGGNLAKFAKDKENLSRSDIQAALKNPNVSQQDKDMLKLVDKHYSELGHWYEFKGVNKEAIKDFYDHMYNSNDLNDHLANEVGYDVANTFANQALRSHRLYATGDAKTSIGINDVHQGRVRDCTFEAALGAVALQHPGQIANAIKDNGNGTYTVTFPGASKEPVTVKAPTDAELGLYNGAGNGGTWAAVMEKAYGQYLINHGAKALTPQDATDYQSEAQALRLLTGKEIDSPLSGSSDKAAVEAALEKAFSSNPHKAVTASIDHEGGSKRTADGFQNQHAYTITGFVPDGHGGGAVTIRNPWGFDVNGPAGVVTIPLDEFMRNFTGLNVEK